MDVVLRKVHDKIQQNFKRTGGGSKFFRSSRKGEGAELHEDLNSNDRERQKNAVKRIIAGMTLGHDVSFLFMDVVKLGQTPNLELKKLVYLYVLNTAKLQPDKALMAVNTFLQDATNSSPIVRALAVRTMMCIRVDSVIEYTLEPLRRAVSDTDPYVRKTAAIGIGKLFHHNMQLFDSQGFSTELLSLLNDNFSIVAANAAAVLAEVNDFSPTPVEPRGDYINRLLHHLPESTEWGQVYILELLARARPSDEEGAETIVARVLPRLSHTNPSVVMGAIKVIANMASRCGSDAVGQYGTRVNSALVTLAKSDAETQYVVCKNIHGLLVVFPNLMRNSLDSFYVRFTDPPFVKLEKLRLLLKLVTPVTAPQIVKELEEYSSEVDLVFANEIVSGIATLALKIESVAPACVDLLMRIVGKRPELLPQVITSCKNIVRRYPELLVLEKLITEHGADSVPQEEAKVSLIWMLGEYCDFIEDGMQIIQQFINELASCELSVQMAILSAVIKMFLRNPQGMQSTLNTVLETLTTRSEDPDLRDRAYAYWRLLSKGVGVAKMKEIVHGHKPPLNTDSAFSDAMTMADLKRSINTASVIFGKAAHSFLPPYGLTNDDEEEDDEEDDADDPTVAAVQNSLPNANPSTGAPSPTTAAPTPAKYADPFDDLFTAPAAPAPSNPPLGRTDLFRPAPAPPLPPLVVPAGPGGVALHCGVVDGPALRIGIVNHKSLPVEKLLLQVNLNALGYLPAGDIAGHIAAVPPGATAVADLPLCVSERHFDAARHGLEVGLKGENLPLNIFRVDVPPERALLAADALEPAAFAAQWRALDQAAEAKQLLGDAAAAMLAAADRRAVLERCRIAVVAERVAPDAVALQACVLTTLELSGLVEIVLNRLAPAQSYVCVRSHRVAAVAPVVAAVMTAAFPKTVQAPSEARQAPNSTLDSLFA